MGLAGRGDRAVLSPRDHVVLSEYRLSLMASSRLCTPKALSRIELEAIEDSCRVTCASCGILRPRGCALIFSMSRSLRKKKVVGPEGPGFDVGGGSKADFLDLSVRPSCGAYILIARHLSRPDTVGAR